VSADGAKEASAGDYHELSAVIIRRSYNDEVCILWIAYSNGEGSLSFREMWLKQEHRAGRFLVAIKRGYFHIMFVAFRSPNLCRIPGSSISWFLARMVLLGFSFSIYALIHVTGVNWSDNVRQNTEFKNLSYEIYLQMFEC